MKYNDPISRYKQNQKPKSKQQRKVQENPTIQEIKTQPQLVPTDIPEKPVVAVQLEDTQKPEKLEIKPKIKKLFRIFSKTTKPPKSRTRLKKKHELDQKLAPNIISFMQRKVVTKDESIPSTRARAVPGKNRDVPTPVHTIYKQF